MGYTTDFVGHIDIVPGLNEAELAYLIAFVESRRFDRPGGPYDVPGDPGTEEAVACDPHRYNRPPAGQPGLYCDWTPCWDGCCLSYRGTEKFYGAVLWLRYLISHFLGPGALASRSGDPRFAGFAFDHVLNGMVVGCRRDNKQLFAITVEANRVGEQILRAADRRYLGMPPLPYEAAADSDLSAQELRRRGERQAQVLPFIGRSPEARRPETTNGHPA